MSEAQMETNSEVETKAPEATDNNKVESQVEGANANNTKGRRSSGKPKISRIMKDVQEGEALLKEMGHEIDGADEGRRRTRSSTRGGPPPPPTPPPVKRERRSGSSTANNSAEKQNSASNQGRGRGRPKRNEADEVANEEKSEETKAEAAPTSNSVDAEHNHEPVKPAPVEKSDKESLPERVNAEVVPKDSAPEAKVQKSTEEKVVEKVEPPVTVTPGNNIAPPAPTTPTRNDTNALNKVDAQPQLVISTPPPAAVPAAGLTPPTSAPTPQGVEQSKAVVAEPRAPEKDIPVNASLPPKSESDSAQPNSNNSAEPQTTDAEKVQ